MRRKGSFPFLLSYGAFLIGTVLGSAAGFFLLRNSAFALRFRPSGSGFLYSLLFALLPILPVLFAGTSTLGLAMIPALFLLRGWSFSFAVCVFLTTYGLPETIAVLALPGFFYLTAFFLSGDSAVDELLRAEHLPGKTKTKNILLIYILLLMGAVTKTYCHTLF